MSVKAFFKHWWFIVFTALLSTGCVLGIQWLIHEQSMHYSLWYRIGASFGLWIVISGLAVGQNWQKGLCLRGWGRHFLTALGVLCGVGIVITAFILMVYDSLIYRNSLSDPVAVQRIEMIFSLYPYLLAYFLGCTIFIWSKPQIKSSCLVIRENGQVLYPGQIYSRILLLFEKLKCLDAEGTDFGQWTFSVKCADGEYELTVPATFSIDINLAWERRVYTVDLDEYTILLRNTTKHRIREIAKDITVGQLLKRIPKEMPGEFELKNGPLSLRLPVFWPEGLQCVLTV